MKIKNSVIILLLLAFVIACQDNPILDVSQNEIKNNETIKIDSTLGFTVLVKHNTLHFPNSEEVLGAMDILSRLTSDERRKWEESIGFTSFQTIFEDIKTEIIADNKGENFDEIVKNNKAFIKKASECHLSVKPRVYGKYAYITNSLGYYITQTFVQKIYDGKLYSGYLYDLPAIAAKSHEDEFVPPFDLSKFDIEVIVLDEKEAENLKSFIEFDYATATGVCFRMGEDYDREDWDKKARFTMGLKNYYVASSVA